MQGVTGEAAFQMLNRANELERQGRSIIHMEIGEPDFDTPAPVVTAGLEWLKKARRITPQFRAFRSCARRLHGIFRNSIPFQLIGKTLL